MWIFILCSETPDLLLNSLEQTLHGYLFFKCFVSKCFLKQSWEFVLYPHFSHFKCLLVVCKAFICILKSVDWVNCFPQWLQLNFFIFRWIASLCRSRLYLVRWFLLQRSHTCNFIPWWAALIWSFKYFLFFDVKSHSSQEYENFKCTAVQCSFRPLFWENSFPQVSHLNCLPWWIVFTARLRFIHQMAL